MKYHSQPQDTLIHLARRANTHAGVDAHEEQHEEEQDTPQRRKRHQGQRLGVDDES